MTAHVDVASLAWAVVALVVLLRGFQLAGAAIVARAAEVRAVGARMDTLSARVDAHDKTREATDDRLVRVENALRR